MCENLSSSKDKFSAFSFFILVDGTLILHNCKASFDKSADVKFLTNNFFTKKLLQNPIPQPKSRVVSFDFGR